MMLPKGWADHSVSEVAAVNPRKSVTVGPDQPVSFVPMAAVDEVSGLITGGTSRPYQEVARGFTHFRNGDVILAKITPSMENGKAAVARGLTNGTGLGSTEFHVLRSKGAVLPEYVWHYVRQKSFRDNARLVMKGAVGQQRVPADYLGRHRIPVPPLAEQARIVERLDDLLSVTAGVADELGSISGLVSECKRRLLALACSGGLTADWRTRTGTPTGAVVNLADVVERLDYGSSSKSEKEGRVPVLRMGNIQDGRLDWNELVYSSDPDEIVKYSLRPGDVLFNRTNSPVLVGKTAVFHGEREAIFAGYLIRVRCKPVLRPDYLGYCLNGPAGRAYCWKVKSDGVSQSNINAKKLAAFKFLLPSIDEQDEIHRLVTAGIDWLDQITSQCSSASRLLPTAVAAIQSKAFRGELVAQSTTDEPTDALMRRLEADERFKAAEPKSANPITPKVTRMSPKRSKVKDLLLADAAVWPSEGITFPDLAKRVPGSHDELRDALFDLLGASSPPIIQRFDKLQKRMVLQRGAA